MKGIILASASPRRIELLRQLELEFEVLPSNIDESSVSSFSASELVKELSYAKASSVAKQLNKDCLVIGADTVVVKNGILGKPKDRSEAFYMLKQLQGEWHEVVTGVTIVDALSLESSSTYELTRVKMREMSDDFINSYINTGEHSDKAGSYAIQGFGSMLVERIEGCYFNVVGLPIMRLSIMLENFGIYLI